MYVLHSRIYNRRGSTSTSFPRWERIQRTCSVLFGLRTSGNIATSKQHVVGQSESVRELDVDADVAVAVAVDALVVVVVVVHEYTNTRTHA